MLGNMEILLNWDFFFVFNDPDLIGFALYIFWRYSMPNGEKEKKKTLLLFISGHKILTLVNKSTFTLVNKSTFTLVNYESVMEKKKIAR